MTKWAKIALGAAAVLVIGAVVWGWPSRGPVYKGHGVREYLEVASLTAWPGTASYRAVVQARIAHLDEPLRNPDEALQFFGTNSIPYLRAALRARDTWTWKRRMLVWLAVNAPWLRVHVPHAMAEHEMAINAYHRILQHGCWGRAGDACESEVFALITNNVYPTITATSVLDGIRYLRRTGQIP